jgi:ABC-type lipoprotein release transport system permease subunit
VLVSGVDPALEPLVSNISEARRRISGAYLRPRSQLPFKNQPADIYVGAELAKTLNLQIGDRTLLTLSPRGASRPTSAAFLVRGIFKTGVNEIDQTYIEIPLHEAQKLLQMKNQVTVVALHLHRLEETTMVTRTLQSQLPASLEVLPWEQALKELHDAIVLDDGGLYLMMAIIFVIMAIGIFNTVLMSVVERTREFGVMMALGTRSTQIFLVVLAEGMILALVAAALGLAGGLGIHSWIASTGIDITSFASDYEIAGIILEGRIYSRLTTAVVVQWTLVVIGLTMAASLYPALRATRLQPVEAIRHV